MPYGEPQHNLWEIRSPSGKSTDGERRLDSRMKRSGTQLLLNEAHDRGLCQPKLGGFGRLALNRSASGLGNGFAQVLEQERLADHEVHAIQRGVGRL